jgi:hypothetical protein
LVEISQIPQAEIFAEFFWFVVVWDGLRCFEETEGDKEGEFASVVESCDSRE